MMFTQNISSYRSKHTDYLNSVKHCWQAFTVRFATKNMSNKIEYCFNS